MPSFSSINCYLMKLSLTRFKAYLAQAMAKLWYTQRLSGSLFLLLPFVLLLPFSLVYAFLVLFKHWLKTHFGSVYRPPVFSICVGNLTVGGTGKTPTVAALAQALRDAGWHPGIVSKGYGRDGSETVFVTPQDSAQRVGDEPLWLCQTTGLPVAVGSHRPATIDFLLRACQKRGQALDLILLDDGLQDTSLRVDRHLAVLDAERGLGNGHCLPLGPLREPFALQRLREMDAIIIHGQTQPDCNDYGGLKKVCHLTLEPIGFQNLGGLQETQSVSDFVQTHGAKTNALHAVAGIGHPKRFFQSLSALGLSIQAHQEHVFPDHHPYQASDFNFIRSKQEVIILTEKDAVKCQNLPKTLQAQLWVLLTTAKLQPMHHLLEILGCDRVASTVPSHQKDLRHAG